MANKVRTQKDFEAKTFKTTTAPGVAVEENVTIKNIMPTKKIVGLDTDAETVLRYDQEGVVLIFEQKEKFLPLDEGTVQQMSRENKARYWMAKEFHDTWRGDEHAALVEKFQVVGKGGSALDKLKVKMPGNMKHVWASPDNIASYRDQGYKVVGADEANTFLGPKGGHHEIGVLGRTDNVLMAIPKEIADQRRLEDVRRNNEKAGMWKATGVEELNRSGTRGSVETGDDRRGWSELPMGGED